jgi:hypothetical protein
MCPVFVVRYLKVVEFEVTGGGVEGVAHQSLRLIMAAVYHHDVEAVYVGMQRML